MADEKSRSTPKNSGGNRREGSSEAPRPTMAFRVNAGLYEKIKSNAQKYQLTITEEIERRLTRSFELEIELAAKDNYIAAMVNTERLLWPDESARVLGSAFAMALSAVRYTGGKDWRDDDAVPAIISGVVRRIVDHCNRTHGASSTVYELVYPQRIASTIESVSASLVSYLDKTMPELPPLQPQDEPANWTSRARGAVVFHDRATGDLVELVEGAEYDVTEHEPEAEFPAECTAAVMRYAPRRETIDAETFNVRPLKDGSAVWYSISRPGRAFVIPEGQGAPPAFEPALAIARPTSDAPPVDHVQKPEADKLDPADDLPEKPRWSPTRPSRERALRRTVQSDAPVPVKVETPKRMRRMPDLVESRDVPRIDSRKPRNLKL